jgi:heat shock protein HslJ
MCTGPALLEIPMSFFAHVRRLAACALATVALAACTTPAQRQAEAARYQPAYSSDFLAQTSWILVRWSRPDGGLRPVPSNDPRNRPITISFTHQGSDVRVTGFAGCNTYSSNYSISNGNVILTTDPVATRMACYPADRSPIERDYLAGLTRIRATSVDNYGNPRLLSLSLDNGETLEFSRRIDPVMGGQEGATKLVYVNSQRVACDAGVVRTTCYQVRDSDNQPWQFWYGDIRGFDFQPGVLYRLRVVETPITNPPPDMPAVQWTLAAVVEQRVVGH